MKRRQDGLSRVAKYNLLKESRLMEYFACVEALIYSIKTTIPAAQGDKFIGFGVNCSTRF